MNHTYQNTHLIVSYLYGTEGSLKGETVYNQVVLSQRYNIKLTLIRPKIYYIFHNQEDPEVVYKDRYKKTFVKTQNVILFPDSIKKKSRIYSIEKAHLFTIEEIKSILFQIKKINPQAMVIFLGLDRDHFGNVYDSHTYLMSISTYTERLPSECVVCGEQAEYTQATDENGVEIFLNSLEDQILYELYEPRCEDCFIYPENDT